MIFLPIHNQIDEPIDIKRFLVNYLYAVLMSKTVLDQVWMKTRVMELFIIYTFMIYFVFMSLNNLQNRCKLTKEKHGIHYTDIFLLSLPSFYIFTLPSPFFLFSIFTICSRNSYLYYTVSY